MTVYTLMGLKDFSSPYVFDAPETAFEYVKQNGILIHPKNIRQCIWPIEVIKMEDLIDMEGEDENE